MEKEKQLYAAAIHQAGHAVAAIKLGLAKCVKSISIQPGLPPFGRVEYVNLGWPIQNYKISGQPFKKVSNLITIFLAGPAAEEKYTGEANEEAASTDNEEASKRAWQYSPTPGELITSLQRDAERLFTLKGNDTPEWQMVIRIADALMEHKKLDNPQLLEFSKQ